MSERAVVRRRAGAEERLIVGVRVNAHQGGSKCHDERLGGDELDDAHDQENAGGEEIAALRAHQDLPRP